MTTGKTIALTMLPHPKRSLFCKASGKGGNNYLLVIHRPLDQKEWSQCAIFDEPTLRNL